MATVAVHVGRGGAKLHHWVVTMLVVSVLTVALAALLGVGNGASGDAEISGSASAAMFSSLPMGVSERYLRALFGEPKRAQGLTLANAVTVYSRCVFYDVLAGNGTYRFCFVGDKLAWKSKG